MRCRRTNDIEVLYNIVVVHVAIAEVEAIGLRVREAQSASDATGLRGISRVHDVFAGAVQRDDTCSAIGTRPSNLARLGR